jgi:putative DNA primase/helicase
LTGGNPEQIDKMFRQSKLFRPKWDVVHHGDGSTYGQKTVAKAIESWETQFRLTDLGNAKRFAGILRNEAKFSLNEWYLWDGKRLKKDKLQAIYLKTEKVLEQIRAEAERETDSDTRKKIWQHMLQLEGRHKLENMIKLTESQPNIAIDPEELDSDIWLFNTENGTIDLKNGMILPHSIDNLMTKMSPVRINAKAEAPTWDRFLKEIMPKEDVRLYLQRAVGSSMTGDITEQILFFLYGTGANGKSTFSNVISKILGDYGMEMPVDALMAKNYSEHTTFLYDLRGTRFALATEPSEGKRFNEGILKQITGGERIVARRMYENNERFTSNAKLWIMGNHKPKITGTDYAIWRRIHLIPFTITIPPEKRDNNLWLKLEAELSGIFNWCLEGVRMWREQGLNPPATVLNATEEYRMENDVVQDFINDHAIVNPEGFVLHSALYSRYSKSAAESNERVLSSKAFAAKLRDKGFIDTRRTGNQLFWQGLELRIREGEQREM